MQEATIACHSKRKAFWTLADDATVLEYRVRISARLLDCLGRTQVLAIAARKFEDIRDNEMRAEFWRTPARHRARCCWCTRNKGICQNWLSGVRGTIYSSWPRGADYYDIWTKSDGPNDHRVVISLKMPADLPPKWPWTL